MSTLLNLSIIGSAILRSLDDSNPSKMSSDTSFNENNDSGSDNSAVYVVEAVLDYRTRRGKKEYKIKWDGFDEITWEPAESCNCEDMIKKFHEDHPEKITASVSTSETPARRGRAKRNDTTLDSSDAPPAVPKNRTRTSRGSLKSSETPRSFKRAFMDDEPAQKAKMPKTIETESPKLTDDVGVDEFSKTPKKDKHPKSPEMAEDAVDAFSEFFSPRNRQHKFRIQSEMPTKIMGFAMKNGETQVVVGFGNAKSSKDFETTPRDVVKKNAMDIYFDFLEGFALNSVKALVAGN